QGSQNPKYPRYNLKEQRQATFLMWPRHAFEDVEALVEAGLFYEGKSHSLPFSENVLRFICSVNMRQRPERLWSLSHSDWRFEDIFIETLPCSPLHVPSQGFSQQCSLRLCVVHEADEVKDKLISTIMDEAILKFYSQFGIGQKKLREAVTYLLDRGVPVTEIKERKQIEEALKVVTRIKKDEVKPETKSTSEPAKNSCAVCLDEQKSVLFLPCQHLVTCVNCGTRVQECPMCRAEISQRIRAFLC
ncbi:unnamed protein product, partial [Ixodes hexagonus]